MKKFNGTDYDGLLPLAYNALNSENSALLGGKSFENIQQYVQSENKLIKIGDTIKSESANAAMSFNLQRIDMTKIKALLLTFTISTSGSGTNSIYINDTSLGYLSTYQNGTCTGICYITRNVTQFSVQGYRTDGTTTFDHDGVGHGIGGASINWSDIRSVTVNGYSLPRVVLDLYGLLL